MATTFMFFDRSRDALAGYGIHETLRDGDDFSLLDQVKNWRRILSNFYTGEDKFLFALDGREWRTVEHYVQASKFKDVNKSHYRSFSVDGGMYLGTAGSGAEARKAGKEIRFSSGARKDEKQLSQEQLEKWNERKERVMKDALYAKFQQNQECENVLALTGDSILTHKMSRYSPITVDYLLMDVRSNLGHMIVENGTKLWYRNDRYHRIGGPAVETFYGSQEWWINGEYIDDEDPNR